MSIYDKIVKATHKRVKERDKKTANLDMYSTGAAIYHPTKPEEFVIGPKWWQEMTGAHGIPYGFIVQVAGNTDSGKSSAAIEFMRKAQEQDVVIILADTERKTTKTRLTQWGVDPDKILLVRGKTLEDMYQGIDDYLETTLEVDPKAKILLIIDSLGNTVSETEAESSIRDSIQMGRRANVNNRAFSRLLPRLGKNIAMLVINQTYDNMGSPGKTNKGGKNKDFYCVLTFQTTRIGWLEGQVKGEKVRKGAKVKWVVYKNHLIDNDKLLGKQYELDVTGAGMALKGEVPEKFSRIENDEMIIDEETGEIIDG